VINFDPSTLPPFFRFRDGTVALGATAKTIVTANTSRVLFAVKNDSGTVQLRPGSDATALLGFNIPVTQPPIVFDFAQWGSVVGQSWSAIASGPGPNLYWFEIIYVPQG